MDDVRLLRCFFLFWEWSIDWFEVPQYISTSPQKSYELCRPPTFDAIHLYHWLGNCSGICGSNLPGHSIGVAITFSNILRKTLYPFLSAWKWSLNCFCPLFISWLGFGLLPKVIIVFWYVSSRLF